MKVTLKQIAEQAGVSINTVSLALRDMPNINPETRTRICEIAAGLGYYAQNNRHRNVETLCLISTGAHLKDAYFYSAFQQVILSQALKHGYNMVVYDYERWEDDAGELQRQLSSGMIGGILLLGDMDESKVEEIASSRLPIVTVGAHYHNLHLCTFIEDNQQCAYLVMKHLWDQGYRRIGFIGDPLYSTSFMERYQGYCSMLRRWKLSQNPAWEILSARADDSDISDTLEASLRALDDMPDAFFCANDYLGVGAVKALHNIGLSVPQDISLVGVDNNPMGKMAIPSLTSIDVRCQLQAELAVSRLISFTRGEKYEPLRFVVPTVFSPGSSVRRRTEADADSPSI